MCIHTCIETYVEMCTYAPIFIYTHTHIDTSIHQHTCESMLTYLPIYMLHLSVIYVFVSALIVQKRYFLLTYALVFAFGCAIVFSFM